MKIRTLTTLMVTFMVSTLVSAQDMEVDGIYYSYDTSTLKAQVVAPPIDVYYTGDIVIPATVTKGRFTFEVTAISRSACNSQRMTSVRILSDGNKGVKTIDEYAFNYCYNLTSIELPATLTSIGKMAFYNCEKLKSIVIPDGVKTIERATFSGCKALESVTFPREMDPQGIGENAFYKCGLKTLTLPHGLKLTEESAFAYNRQLTEVNLPDDFMALNHYMFQGCSKLKSISLPASLQYIMYGVFEDVGLLSLTIPSNVEVMFWDAIGSCDDLKELIIQDSAEGLNVYESEIDRDFFESLEYLYLGRNIDNPYYEEDNTFPELTKLVIGPKVTKLPYTFANNLKEITSYVMNPNKCSEKFTSRVKANAVLRVPQGTYDAYCAASGWKDFFFIEEFQPDAIQNIATPSSKHSTLYDLSGREIEDGKLPRGIYILNGKKVAIK